MLVDLALALKAKQNSLKNLLPRRNVIGVGVGYKVTSSGPTDELSVVVNVAQKVSRTQLTKRDLIPRTIENVRTDVVATGLMQAFEASPRSQQQSRMRPIAPGVSLSHAKVTAGTFGCLVRRDDQIFMLSNNHVLADSNEAQLGDLILQPGQTDGGLPEDVVAELAEFIPLRFAPPASSTVEEPAGCNVLAALIADAHSTTNEVDAALARPRTSDLVKPDIIAIGRPLGSREADLGSFVKKTGRTTGYTEGRIVQIDVTISVMYNGRPATFSGQMMAGPMSAPGDSGSAVLDAENYVVGLLYAGSNTNTLITPIGKVLQALGVTVVTEI